MLEECEGDLSLAHLIDDCSEVRDINVVSCSFSGVNELLSHKFNMLENLSILGNVFDIDSDALARFIVFNPELISLTISTYTSLRKSDAVRLISQNMKRLQRLYWFSRNDEVNQGDFEWIGQSRSLKELGLSFNGLEVAPLAKSLVANRLPIQFFVLHEASIDDDAVKYISKLKQIKGLIFVSGIGWDIKYLIDLSRNLPELEVLHIGLYGTHS